jgi:DNA-binding ferritin-like protein
MKAIVNLIKLQNQLRILHWQAEGYGEHKALGKVYEDLDELIDELVEVHSGKYGKIKFESPIDLGLVNREEVSIMDLLEEFTDYLVTTFAENFDTVKDSDCLNIRDEILAVIDRLKYLLTLK